MNLKVRNSVFENRAVVLSRIALDNFGPIPSVDWSNLAGINLVIGDNGCGKTFLLKAAYSGVRALEAFKRGQEQRTLAEILFEKLYWTFQADKIGDLVSRGSARLQSCLKIDGKSLRYGFGKETTKQIPVENEAENRPLNSIFLPAKEVLSLHSIILKSREQDQVFGFDDTYLDLARALRVVPTRGKNYSEFAQSRHSLEQMIGGKIEFEETPSRWFFRKGQQKFPIGVTAEGVRKIAILDTLLGNRYLTPGSIVFIDEPEAALHPAAISSFLDILAALAAREPGLQFFLSSHSYFVVKKLFLIAQEKNISIPVLSHGPEGWVSADLRQAMPDNSIVDESIRLYQQEVELSLQ